MAPEAKPSGAYIAQRLCEDIINDDFFKNNWEKKPLHVRAAERERPANLLPEALGADDLMVILKECGSSLKMFKRGVPCEIDDFRVAYLDGSSLIVNQADRCNETLFELCRSLADRHFHHVFCVGYLTPANSQAVRLHNDDQDVFLLQVWGRKRWTIRNAPQLLAYTEEMLGKEEAVPEGLVGDPVMEFTIEPGDFLYMPRGQLHEAATGDEPSLHITITVPTSDFCWGVQLVKHFMHELDVGQLAQAKPLASGSLCGRGQKDQSALDQEIRDLLGAWSKGVKPGDVLDAFEQRMAKTNQGQEREYTRNQDIKLGPAVTERSRVRLMCGVTCQVHEEAEMVTFVRAGDGQELEMPVAASALPLLKSLTNRPQPVLDLPSADPFERICVLQLLNQQGVVQLFVKGPDN